MQSILRSALALLVRSAPALVPVLALAPDASGQCWSDRSFRPGLPGRVFATAVHQGELVAGGLGLVADGEFPGNVARFDGQRWRKIGEGVFGDDVRAITTYQSELVVAGEFTNAGGSFVRSVARWNGTEWLPLGQGLDLSFASTGRVFALAVYGGELYAGGEFDLAGGQPARNLARWDGEQWRPVAGGVTGTRVQALLAAPDGNLYVGGEFVSAGGQAGTPSIAVWNGSAWASLDGGLPAPANAGVWDLEWYGGELWAGGNFDVPGGAIQEKVGIWDGTSWRAAGTFPDSSISTLVYALEVYDGDLYAAGNIVQVDGVGVDRIARWDGASWSAIGGVGLSQTTLVMQMTVHDGKLVVGGEFDRAGTQILGPDVFCTESVAAFDGAAWSNVGLGLGGDEPEAACLWNGDVVAVGDGLCLGSVLGAEVLVRERNDWRGLADAVGTPEACCVFEGDLVVAGSLTSVEGVPVEGVARFDGVQWEALGTGAGLGGRSLIVHAGELYLGGGAGPALQRLVGSTWQPVGSLTLGAFEFVEHLASFDGDLYGGGRIPSAGNLVRWNGTTLTGVGGGTDGPLTGLAVHGGQLVVGGDFSSAGGVPVVDLARWNGSAWSAFPVSLTGTNVSALGTFAGDLYAGGNLFVPGLPANKYVARWDGSAWLALGGGVNADARLFVANEACGELFVGGLFSQVDSLPTQTGGKPAVGVASWKASCVPGTSALRTAAANPTSYRSTDPVLGATLGATVDLTTTGHSMAALLGFGSPLQLTLASGQVLLVNVADPAGELLALPLVPGPLATFQIPFPCSPSLAGMAVSTQAVHLFGTSPFALSNAVDWTVGD